MTYLSNQNSSRLHFEDKIGKTIASRIDYNYFNYCSTCELKYTKVVIRCQECQQKVRTIPWPRSKVADRKRIWNRRWTHTACKGICSLYKASRSKDKFYYLKGRKRCTECEVFLNYTKVHCPCCGSKLRTKPRNIKAKERNIWFKMNHSHILPK